MVSTSKHRKSDIIEASLLFPALVLYSNGLSVWSLYREGDPEKPFKVLNPLFLGAMLLYTRLRPGVWKRSGLTLRGSGKSTLWGLALGAALSGPPLFFFYRPILLDTPLEYGPVANLSRREMLVELLLRLPINVALLEEIAFRGLLYGALRRSTSVPVATVVSALGFAGWHITVTATTAAETNLSNAKLPRFLKPLLQPLAVLGGMLSTGIAGALFALVRERTGSLAGAIVAHWVVDSLMVLALWLRRTPASVK